MRGIRVFFLCSTLVICTFGSLIHAKDLESPPTLTVVPGEILVKVKASVLSPFLVQEQLHQLTGAKVIQNFKSLPGLQHLYVGKRDLQEMISYYEAQLWVEYAEPNFIYTIDEPRFLEEGAMPQGATLPNDTLFGQLWGLHNTGQKDAKGNDGFQDADIDALEAWETTQGDKNVLVAVIDTGIDYTQEDLAANMWTNAGEIPDNKIDDDNNGFIDDIHGWDFSNNDNDPMDDHSHGTHVAGTIGAVGNNEKGVIGISPNVRLMASKFLGAGGSGTLAGAVSAIDYAVMMKAQILNNSWGGGGYSQALADVIEKANKNNVLFVAAAGNDSSNNDVGKHYPSSYEHANVVAVAATNNQDALSKFSNYGFKSVHVSAPGENILSSVPGNNYKTMSGTSMATPHVVGVAALLLAVDPTLTHVAMKERLMKTSDEILSIRRKVASSGRVNAFNAIHNKIPPKKSPKDPGQWTEAAYKLSTPHNYLGNTKETWMIHHEGATHLKIHFAKFDTEEGYDQLKIKDKNGVVIDLLEGPAGETWSFIVLGDTATLSFESDESVNKYGFDIDKYSYSLESAP
ncbi:MAG: S8 family serine peptidase [Deltaproteobacteria bacterium]|nr:S8 family serine peptidase [Deltaproteobacteria bacterium]